MSPMLKFLSGGLIMTRRQALIFFGALIYIEYRWGWTINRFFVITFLLTTTLAAYHLISLVGSALMLVKSHKLLSRPIAYYRRKTLIYILIASAAFYGFYSTQLPGQLERYQTIIESEFRELTRKETPPEEDSSERYSVKREGLVSEIASAGRKINEWSINKKEIIREIALGWNTSTADTENDHSNWEKATDLLKKYSSYIGNAQGQSIQALKALENPSDYYGEIVTFRGQVYSAEQLPPDNSVAQFFDGPCYHVMLAVKDKKIPVLVSAYIVSKTGELRENASVKVKGFIYGQARLVNSAGGVTNGLAFVGLHE